MTLDDWYVLAATDADRRNLADLTPVLKGLHGAAKTLRAAPWNDDSRGSTPPEVTASAPSEQSQPQQSQSSPRASS